MESTQSQKCNVKTFEYFYEGTVFIRNGSSDDFEILVVKIG